MTKFAIAALVLVAMAPQQKGPYSGWHTVARQAFDEARATGKPLFVVFR